MEDDLKKAQKLIARAERKQEDAGQSLTELHAFLYKMAEKHEVSLGVSVRSVIPKNPNEDEK